MVIRIRHIAMIFALLFLGSIANEAWADYKVTYHILTLPLDHTAGTANTNAAYDGKRIEAIKAIAVNPAKVKDLPDHFKSPLAKNFTYWDAADVTKSANAELIYPNHNKTKHFLYEIRAGATPLNEETALSENRDIFVTYEYNPDNGIAKLDGTESYNIAIGNGFLAYNKGRNNRMAVIPANKVSGEQLASEQFVKIDVKGTDISAWWSGNLTPQATAESYFHLLFKYIGEDPYNITIVSAFEGSDYYIEQYGSSESKPVNKYYEGSSLFARYDKTSQSDELLIASDDNKKYKTENNKTNYTSVVESDPKPGYYRNLSTAIWNSFAMLNNTNGSGYVFMGTRCVNGSGVIEIPNESNKSGNNYKYYYLNINNGNKLYYTLQTAATATNNSSSEPEMYEVYTYTFKVKTPFGNIIQVTKKWSEAYGSQALLDHIPDELKRKYVTFEGAYKTDALDGTENNTLTTFADADGNSRVIWLKYSVDDDIPFMALSAGQSFTDARWYTIRMNGDHETQYIAYRDGSTGNFYTGGGSNGDLHQGENSLEAQVAFMGDPFELRIISHKASHVASPEANRYIGCPSSTTVQTTFTAVTDADICGWEIIDDETAGSFKLRQYGTYASPWYFGWDYAGANRPIIYTQSDASPIKVVEMAKKTYVYHIYNSANQIAVKASASQDVGIPLKYTNIPEIIRSPLIQPGLATISYYSDAACTEEITHAPFNVTADANKDIYVKYTITNPSAMPTGDYLVRLYTKYIYHNSGDISWSDDAITENNNYIWHLDITDPYNMIISNQGASNYIKVDGSLANKVRLTWDVEGNASKFVVKSSGNGYEVMAAAGDGVDAAETYYNIGRNNDDGVRIYSNDLPNGGYAHNYDQLRFVLAAINASSVDFHLIDKANHELMVVRRRTNDLYFPDQFRSPLVSTYHYWSNRDCNATLASVALATESAGVKQVYVTYDTNSLINLRKGALYLLKYYTGDSFRQENGADDLTAGTVTAVYPYCNGDCNFFVYGQDEYELQQQGAASTRTRWAWYLESATNDPYHVKICTRQIETYNGYDHQGYFYTFAKRFNGEVSGHHVVTSLAWPGITGVQGTEYMVLGTVTDETRQFQLMTTYPVPVDLNDDGDTADEGESAGERQVVKEFEQYWKTYDTVKNKLLKNILVEEDKGANPEGATTVPTDPVDYRALLTGTGSGQYGFHSYDYYAYAKRFNGYNASGATSKGWEKIEHWYQTVNMGEGYFDLEATIISPVLILLDQHGWEIMRKPLPYSDKDPRKEQKKDVLRSYDSPMVKEYYYWASAKKRSGFHQYYQLEKRIGGDYTSTSLGDLPTWGSENVLDAKGNQNDEYVTYTVKDEYLQAYSVEYTTAYDADAKITKITGVTGTGVPFLIQQGDRYAFTNGSSITANTVPSTGGMSQWIIDHISDPIGNGCLWYLKPNTDIDNEMGYGDPRVSSSINWVNDYRDQAKVKASGFNSWAFDPYNIQISSVADPTKYFVTNATGGTLEEGDGAILGTYGGSTPGLELGERKTGVTCSWYDSRALDITNTTFMAVQDLAGNLQLMPRFDQTRRVRNFDKLVTPTAEAGDPTKLTETHTKLFRPIVYNYHIIDNAGFESLRYQSGGDLVPQTPGHFKSPLAKDFKYYKTLTSTGSNAYDLSTLADEITELESFAGKGLTSSAAAGNDVYVRYSYDEEADADLILKGKWFTMQLNGKDTKYDSGIKQGTPKPSPMNATNKAWQWKFLETPLTDPDPYAVCLFNRDYNETRQNEPLLSTRFALLPHTGYSSENRVYALAKAGSGDYTYQFLNGSGMDTSTPVSIAEDKEAGQASGFTSTSCSFHSTDSKVELIDDVLHTYTYKVYTNENVLAIEAEQPSDEASDNDFMPELPSAAMSPLMNDEDFRYYYNNNVWSPKITVTDAMKLQFPELETVTEIPDTIGKSIKYIYGLYDDVIHVHYMPYNPDNSSFLVPNDKTLDDGHAARGSRSNDAALGLDGNLLYNIVWYNDNMMKVYDSNTDGVLDAIQGVAAQPLQASDKTFVWQLEGNDPYAIKIKNYDAGKYISSTAGISDDAQTFMLIPQDGYGYGVLAVTGNKGKKLTIATDDGNLGTNEAVSIAMTDAPTKYVIFALATNTVIYHLMIANTGEDIVIPYKEEEYGTLNAAYTLPIKGSTQRDLTSKNTEEGIAGEKYALGETIMGKLYCKEVGPISLGDKLAVPEVLYRPNVVYEFYVDQIYAPEGSGELTTEQLAELASLNDRYKGTLMEYMGDDPRLVGKRVFVNVVYSFNGTLETNAGADFVRSVAENKWYTFESKKADGTPQLMQFTNAWGTEVKEGRGTHYTNDYLWTPLGDPYGFKMYHRYTCVNSGNMNNGEPDRVMTTAHFAEHEEVWMDDGSGTGANKVSSAVGRDVAADNAIYELLEGTTPGYFKIHPVANMTGTQYYFDIEHDLESGSSTVYHDYIRLSSTHHTDFTFGLTEELVKPYYDRAGYVGGLNATGKAAYEAANGNLMELQNVVYNPANIVPFTPGYYRLHSPEDIEGVTVHYASGYTHKLELTGGAGSTPIPMHFYEVEGKSSQFNQLKSKDGLTYDAGYTASLATQGDIPIPAVEYDPASIFYFYEGSSATPLSRVQTQGLYLKGRKGPGLNGSGEVIPANVEGADERAAAVMTETESEATPLYVMDIGGAILLIHDNITANGRQYLKYLSYDQVEADHIYDLKLTHNTHTDHAKWLMQPANHLGLRVTTHSGGDAGTYGVTYNYTTFYAPFDVMLPDTVFNKDKPTQIDKIYHAVVLESANSPWNPPYDLHPKSIGRYNIAANGCPTKVINGKEQFRTNNRFVPAGTPVLLAMYDNAGYIKLTLPNSAPSLKDGNPLLVSGFSADTRTSDEDTNKDTQGSRNNILLGQYLEQKLPLGPTDRIYVFGLPYTGAMSLDESTGEITATLPLQDNSGMGFYLNANPNKELGLSRGQWTRNNWYVYNNKVYYHATGVSSARNQTRGVQFVPVVFDDDEDKDEQDGVKELRVGDGCAYDLLGRCVATAQQVRDGSWIQSAAPGIYIVNGKKVFVGKANAINGIRNY